jgi:hypothetical protein
VIEFDLPGFAKHVATSMSVNVDEAEKFALKLAAALVAHEAKRVIGTYDPEYKWPQLQPETQAERAHLGFPPNEPLLRTGGTSRFDKLRDHGARPRGLGWRERQLGTSTIPPRPFLSGAAAHEEKDGRSSAPPLK